MGVECRELSFFQPFGLKISPLEETYMASWTAFPSILQDQLLAAE